MVSTAAFHARVRNSVPGLGGLKETKCFFPIHVWNSVLWGASVTERLRARPQTARARISNPVSGGQCHLIHLIIFRRFSWPSLAYMCTKVAWSPIHFIFFSFEYLWSIINIFYSYSTGIDFRRRTSTMLALFSCLWEFKHTLSHEWTNMTSESEEMADPRISSVLAQCWVNVVKVGPIVCWLLG